MAGELVYLSLSLYLFSPFFPFGSIPAPSHTLFSLLYRLLHLDSFADMAPWPSVRLFGHVHLAGGGITLWDGVSNRGEIAGLLFSPSTAQLLMFLLVGYLGILIPTTKLGFLLRLSGTQNPSPYFVFYGICSQDNVFRLI